MDESCKTFGRILCIATGALAAALPISSAAAAPAGDPLLSQQWALTQAAGVGAQESWSRSTGTGVVVAVLDTGVQGDHPDMAGSLWTNPGEIAGNGRDDDANGIVDDVHGANMFDNSANVADDNGHGTHVAGIIAARRGNGAGGAGLAPTSTIMPVKVLDAAMVGDTNKLARGIRYAVNEGARIINVSVNGDQSTEDLVAAVRYAGERGATVVASSGNNGRNLDLLPSFPATLPDPAVLSVTATTASGNLWKLANLGRLTVDIAAPGEHILGPTVGSTYQYRMGTSAAAPHVSAALALMASARPELSQAVLRDVLRATSRRSNVLTALLATGILDAGAAMQRLVPGASPSSGQLVAAVAPRLTLRTGRTAKAGSRAKLRWSAAGAATVSQWRVSLDGKVVATVPATRHALSRRVTRAGRHSWRVVGFDAAGAKLLAASRTFRVLPAS